MPVLNKNSWSTNVFVRLLPQKNWYPGPGCSDATSSNIKCFFRVTLAQNWAELIFALLKEGKHYFDITSDRVLAIRAYLDSSWCLSTKGLNSETDLKLGDTKPGSYRKVLTTPTVCFHSKVMVMSKNTTREVLLLCTWPEPHIILPPENGNWHGQNWGAKHPLSAERKQTF